MQTGPVTALGGPRQGGLFLRKPCFEFLPAILPLGSSGLVLQASDGRVQPGQDIIWGVPLLLLHTALLGGCADELCHVA